MRILMADDERMLRLGLRSMLEELYPGRLHFIEARNGREMLQALEEHRPDLAFVDIKMPELDGLSALEKAQEANYHTKFLILTGYADFSFAQAAIKAGVSDYLLKPVSPTDLKAAVDPLLNAIVREWQADHSFFTSHVLRDYNRHRFLGEASILLDGNASYSLFVFYIDQKMNQHFNALSDHLLKKMEEGFCQKLNGTFDYCLFYLAGGELCLLAKGAPVHRIWNDVYAIIQPIESAFVSVLSCREVPRNGIFSALERLCSFSALRFISGESRRVDIDMSAPDIPEMLPLCKTAEGLFTALMGQNETEYSALLGQLEQDRALKEKDYQNMSYVFSFLTGRTVTLRDRDSMQSGFRQMWTCAAASPAPGEDNLIHRINQFTKQHYMDDIGVNVLADIFDLSPNYLSKIYHERTGRKYIDYLTQVRIQNAEKLFEQRRELTVRQVSELVGYYSARYFSKVFAKYTGMLPSEYMEKCV